MATEKSTTRRKSGAVWSVLARGVLLALLLWLAGTLLLTWGLMSGIMKEDGAFPVLSGLTAVAAFAGAVSAVRHTPYGSLVSSLIVAALFALLLLGIGLACWKQILWTGHGGTLLLWTAAGGVVAGILGRRRGKKRARRAW